MAEYIKREDALLKLMQDGCLASSIESIMNIPAADVAPVVRCKDCKYNRGGNKCLNPDSFFVVPADDDFCSYGERKDGGAK